MTSRPELKVRHVPYAQIAVVGQGTDFEFQVDDESGFIASFNKLPETEAIRIFERSDFYTVHGQDALFVAQTVGLW